LSWKWLQGPLLADPPPCRICTTCNQCVQHLLADCVIISTQNFIVWRERLFLFLQQEGTMTWQKSSYTRCDKKFSNWIFPLSSLLFFFFFFFFFFSPSSCSMLFPSEYFLDTGSTILLLDVWKTYNFEVHRCNLCTFSYFNDRFFPPFYRVLTWSRKELHWLPLRTMENGSKS
jgi:hypothetical protein